MNDSVPMARSVRLQGDRWSADDTALFAVLSACVLAGLLAFYAYAYPLHHDLAGNLLSGRLAVALGDSFRDYSTYFPPAERGWYSTAARISQYTGARLDLVIVGMTGAAILVSTCLAYRIRRATVGASPLFLILSVVVLTVLPILFKNVFGLREHLVALGLWPYFVLRVSDPDNTHVDLPTRVFLGVWLAATLLLKYLYCVVVLALEIADALVQRRPALLFRVENLIAGAVVALYLTCWLVLDTSQRTAMSAVISAIDANLVEPATGHLKVAQNLLYAGSFLIFLRIYRVPRRPMALGLAAVVGALIVAWLQERWYTHHLFPIVLAYAGWLWATQRYFPVLANFAVVLCLSYPVVWQFLSTFAYREQVIEVDDAIRRAGETVSGKRVGILCMHPSPYNQYLVSHGAVRWNATVNNSYVAAELESFDRKENEGRLPPPIKLNDSGRRMLHDQMIKLWEDMPPDVLILDHSYRWPLRYVDVEWTHVFSTDPRFNAFMKRYRPVLSHKGKRLDFQYYVRVD